MHIASIGINLVPVAWHRSEWLVAWRYVRETNPRSSNDPALRSNAYYIRHNVDKFTLCLVY
jgi:hypothetical protein